MHVQTGRKLNHLSLLGYGTSLLILVLAITQALRLPIYPDEVSYRIFLERFFLNGGYKQSLFPFCAKGFLAPVPWLLVPAAMVWSVISTLGIHWIAYRLLPLMALTFILVGLLIDAAVRWAASPWPALLLITIGPIGYGLIILRPEVFLLAAGLALVFIAQASWLSRRWPALVSCAVGSLFVYSLIVYIHPKALFFAIIPLVGAVGCIVGIERTTASKVVGIALLGMIVFMSLTALRFQDLQHLSCPELPSVETDFASQSVNPIDAVLKPQRFIVALRQAVSLDVIEGKLLGIAFRLHDPVGFLPPIQTAGRDLWMINLLINVTIASSFLYCALTAALLMRAAQSAREVWDVLLPIAFGLSFLTPFALNLSLAWYEDSFLVGGLAILTCLLRGRINASLSGEYSVKVVLKILVSCVLLGISTASVWFKDAYFTKAFAEGYEGPSIDRYAFNGSVSAAVSKLAGDLPNSATVIVDDLTYEPLHRHLIVIPITYLGLAADQPSQSIAVFARYDVNNAVVRCVSFHTDWFPGWKERARIPLAGTYKDICLYLR